MRTAEFHSSHLHILEITHWASSQSGAFHARLHVASLTRICPMTKREAA